MCKLRTFVLLVSIIPLACQQDKDPPDLVEIASDYCTIILMCDPGDGWKSKDECEMSSAEEFKRTKAENRECFDARLLMETCLGAFESCDEYAIFEKDPNYECRAEFLEFSFACLEP